MYGKRRITACILFCLLLLVAGCSRQKGITKNETEQIKIEELTLRDTDISTQLTFEHSCDVRYAERFAIDYYKGGYTLLTVADGSRFLIVPEQGEVPGDLEKEIVVLQRPIENVYLVASAVMDMFRELDGISNIRFSGHKQENWYIKEAQEAMASGDMLYAGKYNMPDYERIVSENCSVAIENTMITHAPEVIEKLGSFGIPVLIDYSSYEKHPLGRVEWIRFYGALLGKEDVAGKAFALQEEAFETVSEAPKTEKTVAFFYITANDAVNVRKPSDYIPKMIELAGGNYIFEQLGSDTDNRSSVNLQLEEFYAAARDADYLIYNSNIAGEIETVDELLGKCEMLKDFKAVQEGNVWCTTGELYQQSMSAGGFIKDIYHMLSGSGQETKYLYLLK